MNLYNRTLCCIVIFICVAFFSCEKKGASVPEGTPVITEHPKSASYLENDKLEDLTVNASVKEGYNLSYQWYTMNYVVDGEYINPTEQEISIEVNKLISNNPEDSLFRKQDWLTKQSCSIFSQAGQLVYICIVTGTSEDGSKTFSTVSDPAVITIIRHPLASWYTANRNIFAYKIYLSETSNRYMSLRDIAYGGGYFVAVGDRYQFSYSRPDSLCGIIAYSNDGRTWELIKDDSPFTDYGISITAIAYGNGRFIAVGSKGKIAYSTDINTWIPAESTVSETFTDIVYGNGVFVARYWTGLAYSGNGETWSIVGGSDASRTSFITYDNGHFIAGTHNGKISFSDNGRTWITKTGNTFDSHSIVTIAYGNGRYLAFARQDNDHAPSSYIMGYSSDGERWVTVIPSKDTEEWNWIKKIIYKEGYFIAVGNDRAAYSKDGINWHNLERSYIRASSRWEERIQYRAVAYGGGFFVAVSENGFITYCQWPITKAIAPIITEQPRWPSGTYSDHTSFMSITYRTVSFGQSSFQWYRNDEDNTVTGIPIEGANSWRYIPDVSKAGTTYYYIKVTSTIPDYFNVEAENRSASVTSNTAAVIVNPPEQAAGMELMK